MGQEQIRLAEYHQGILPANYLAACEQLSWNGAVARIEREIYQRGFWLLNIYARDGLTKPALT